MTKVIQGFTASVSRNNKEEVVCVLLQFDGIPELQAVKQIEQANLKAGHLYLRTNSGEFQFPDLHEAIIGALQKCPLVVIDYARQFEQQIPVSRA